MLPATTGPDDDDEDEEVTGPLALIRGFLVSEVVRFLFGAGAPLRREEKLLLQLLEALPLEEEGDDDEAAAKEMVDPSVIRPLNRCSEESSIR